MDGKKEIEEIMALIYELLLITNTQAMVRVCV
jgi:hypothetical protein